MAQDEVVETLNELGEICRDAERGFRAAAEVIGDPAVRRLFAAYAQQRAEYVRELDDQVIRRRGTPQRRGSVAGALHRALINVRAAISGRDERTVIAEAERGEDAALARYARALERIDLPPDVRGVIARQAAWIKEAHDRLKDLERAA